MHYYDRERQKIGRWYEWVIVFWMMLATWMVGQFALTSGFEPILRDLDPERANQLGDAMNADMAALAENPGAALALALGLLVQMIAVPLAAIGLLVHYLGARGRGSLITGLIGVFMSLAGLVPLFAANGSFADSNAILMSVIGLSPFAYALMLLTFPAALVGLYWGWTKVQERSLTALHTAFAQFRWGRVVQSFLIGWIVLGGYSVVATALGLASPRFVFDAGRFVPFAVLSLLLLPVQSATEEIAVRGFINKGLISALGNKWVVFTLTSGLFMALHLANPEARAGADAGLLPIVMSGYFFFGFAACLMVLIDDGLESAIGVHAANNTFAAIFVNYENSVLPTPSVWQVSAEPVSDSLSTIVVLLIILALLWVTRGRWLRGPRTEEHPPETATSRVFR